MWPATDGPGPTRANIETFCEYCEAACVRLLQPPCWARAWHHNITQSLLSLGARTQCQLRLGASCELVSARARHCER